MPSASPTNVPSNVPRARSSARATGCPRPMPTLACLRSPDVVARDIGGQQNLHSIPFSTIDALVSRLTRAQLIQELVGLPSVVVAAVIALRAVFQAFLENRWHRVPVYFVI